MNAKFTFRTTEYMSEVLGKYQNEIHKGKQGVMINDLLWKGIDSDLEALATSIAMDFIRDKYSLKIFTIGEAENLIEDVEDFRKIRKEYFQKYYTERRRMEDSIGFNWGAGWIGNHTGRTPDEGDPLSADEVEKNRVAGEDLSE